VLSCGVVKHIRAAFFAGSVERGGCVPNVLEMADERKSVENFPFLFTGDV